MERARNEDNGQYSRERSPEDILRVMERGEIYNTQTIADKTDIPKRTTLRYLTELAEQGRIEREEANSKASIWIRRE